MKLGYRVDGRKGAPTLVLSPSLGTTVSLWQAQIGELAHDFRVIRHDHPGHGISPIPADRVTVAAIAEGQWHYLPVSSSSFSWLWSPSQSILDIWPIVKPNFAVRPTVQPWPPVMNW